MVFDTDDLLESLDSLWILGTLLFLASTSLIIFISLVCSGLSFSIITYMLDSPMFGPEHSSLLTWSPWGILFVVFMVTYMLVTSKSVFPASPLSVFKSHTLLAYCIFSPRCSISILNFLCSKQNPLSIFPHPPPPISTLLNIFWSSCVRNIGTQPLVLLPPTIDPSFLYILSC